MRDGTVKKDYTVRLTDAQGLVSGILNASTKPNKAEAEKVDITKGRKIAGSGSEADPTTIATDSTGAELSVSSATAGVTVHGTLTAGTAESTQYNGNPIIVPLPLNGAGEKTYKLEYYTDGEGFARTDVKTVYYKILKGHTVTFDANGGAYPDGTTAVSKVALHGTAVSAPDPLPAQQGFGVTGWYKDKACSADQAWNFATDTVTGNITLYAQWTAGGGIPYTVEHYQQNVNDDNYPAASTDTDKPTGTTGADAAVTLKNYPGFERGTYTAATIAADGSTVVKVYYQRKQITVTFKPNGGTIDGSTADKPVTGKYGAPLMAPTVERTGYTFSGWQPTPPAPALSSTFPAANAEYTAQWMEKGIRNIR
ncbi:repeat protein [Treponema vincentii ATCC 35580]|uniref:Repeat protein n=1 Tax=Treponema vincentii ATCC 35580 TaxID=596324 RepID=C8PQA2_9SPIR|nr:repeat protein [Treponema vincentii ATCC 35580]